MPELPEVETIRNRLRFGQPDSPSVVGRQITGVRLLWDRTLAEPFPAALGPRLLGQAIQDVGRRGKFLILELSQDALLIHLRMSGDIYIRPQAAPLALHDRLVLDLDRDLHLAFNDTRKFGRAWLVTDPQQVLHGLGPEPLSPDLTPEDFYHRLHARKRLLKPLLLDQTFLAGMGNIYTDEALHRAGLHPLTLSDRLTFEQAQRLLDSIRQVLQEGIQRQGASIDWVYRGGDFQNYFRVYRRQDQPCPTCGTPIRRLVVGQRSTHVCPVCQPDPQQEG